MNPTPSIPLPDDYPAWSEAEKAEHETVCAFLASAWAWSDKHNVADTGRLLEHALVLHRDATAGQ